MATVTNCCFGIADEIPEGTFSFASPAVFFLFELDWQCH